MSEIKQIKQDSNQSAKAKELISKYFPERAEKEKIQSLAKSEPVGVIKAHIAIEELFTSA